jgi:hypothetical protein
VIRFLGALITRAVGAGSLAACDLAGPDPCEGVDTCVLLDVDSVVIRTIDQLQLDVVYDDHHGTTTIGTGQPISVPFSFPLKLNLPGSPLIKVDIIAAGKLAGRVIGAGTASSTVQRGYRDSGFILMWPTEPCVEGALYCGGTYEILADVGSLYRCTGGVPMFHARCSSGCSPHFSPGGQCDGRGLCRDGGTYCGGHVLDGEPDTLYVCESFEGTDPMPCPAGCVVRGDGTDTCS